MVNRFFVVRYLWRGEALSHSRTFATYIEADALAHEMKMDGWRAWVEPRFTTPATIKEAK